MIAYTLFLRGVSHRNRFYRLALGPGEVASGSSCLFLIQPTMVNQHLQSFPQSSLADTQGRCHGTLVIEADTSHTDIEVGFPLQGRETHLVYPLWNDWSHGLCVIISATRKPKAKPMQLPIANIVIGSMIFNCKDCLLHFWRDQGVLVFSDFLSFDNFLF